MILKNNSRKKNILWISWSSETRLYCEIERSKRLVFEPRFAHLWYTRRTHRGKAFIYSYLFLFIIYLLLSSLCWCWQTSFFFSFFFFADSQWSFYDRLNWVWLLKEQKMVGDLSVAKSLLHIWQTHKLTFVWLFWNYWFGFWDFFLDHPDNLFMTDWLTFKRAKNIWLSLQNLYFKWIHISNYYFVWNLRRN